MAREEEEEAKKEGRDCGPEVSLGGREYWVTVVLHASGCIPLSCWTMSYFSTSSHFMTTACNRTCRGSCTPAQTIAYAPTPTPTHANTNTYTRGGR